MRNEIELLAPAGDFECLKAAVQNGANSVYFGGGLFNARASATNFDSDELEKAINYCVLRNVRTHLTLNTLIKDSEFKEAVLLAKKAYELGIDALIVQDVGLAQFLMKLFPDLPIHASTQMTIHNLEGVQELEKLGYSRAVLSRELSIQEIEYICNNSNIEIETFVHGALCISYSGQCFFSSMVGGRSGNRGRCAQPCRLPYELIEKKLFNTCLKDKDYKNFHNTSLKNDFENKETRDNVVSKKSNKNVNNNNARISESIIDKGYLISPRDLCSLDFIPQLIKIGVKCFKIEGRLKSPEYVATVTKIYRKYIDMVLNDDDYIVDEKDIVALKQIFNRGGFSAGHLSTSANHDLVFKEKPNNMGLYIGNVAGYNKLKGHIKLLLNERLAVGDTVNFEKENTKYTVSELMKNTSNISNANIGEKVIIGRMKGNIHIGDKIYKLSSKTQLDEAKNSYNSENIKLPLSCKITIKKNEPVVMEVHLEHLLGKSYKDSNGKQIGNTKKIDSTKIQNFASNLYPDKIFKKNAREIKKHSELYRNVTVKVQSSLIAEKALKNPITKDRIISQIRKTNNTPFEFINIDLDLEDDVFIPSIKELNEIRRIALSKLENIIISKNKRTDEFDDSKLDSIYNKYLHGFLNKKNFSVFCDTNNREENILNEKKNISTSGSNTSDITSSNYVTKTVATYFNILHPEFDYTKLSKKYISCVYIPLRFFMKKELATTLKSITTNFKTYIYMPAIIKANYKNIIKHRLEDLIEQYNIAGFVISSLGDLVLLDKYKNVYEFIGNFSLNVFNCNSINIFRDLGLSKITLSPELNLDDINQISEIEKNHVPLELLVYGNTPIMKMNYCLLGVSNKCYPTCKMRCSTFNKYFLRDRLRI